MCETVTTDRGGVVAHDHHRADGRSDLPPVVFVAGAGPWHEIDPTRR